MPSRTDLNLLLTLETLLAERNVTKAAAKLNSSQPAVSAQLVKLRRMFDDPLLIPGARGMTPTPRALELAPRLSELLDGFRSIVHAEDFDPATAQARILIGTNDATQCRMVRWFGELATTAPGIQIGFVSATRVMVPDIEQYMASGQVDIIISRRSAFPDRLHVRGLDDEYFVCAMRWDHPFNKKQLTAKAFAAMRHVIVSPLGGDFADTTDETLREMGLSRTTGVSVPNFLVAEQILRSTDMVAVFPASLARSMAASLKSYPLPYPAPKIELAMAWHVRTHQSPAHRWVRDQLADLLIGQLKNDAGPLAQVAW
ncbi:HTH-type transcriptional regulator SyrM 1 [Pigmentiphaga humi]|uniref:HTH-type transcriptional regulator SyrM 1 n=1 Tax=Pigmentiphaga humi TaxID=2478468 RepID=A0A3P4B740_9BURK|nr:LysR family transcriptional regulator [Pigmentiphaga humi]VCU70985.1 HTH-type transcriptional regulator SyrM 1 [Pigmentiphaga humi]